MLRITTSSFWNNTLILRNPHLTRAIRFSFLRFENWDDGNKTKRVVSESSQGQPFTETVHQHIHHHRSWRALLLALQNLDIVSLLILWVTPYLSEKLLGMIKLARADLCCATKNLAWHRTLDRASFFKLFIYDFSGSSLLWVNFSLVVMREGLLCCGATSTRQGSYSCSTWALQLGVGGRGSRA